MKLNQISIIALIMLLLALAARAADAPRQVNPDKFSRVRSGGIYMDSAGQKHPWEINEAHTLIWDGAPYIPVGGMFCSKYLTTEQTDANWQEDVQGLQTLKSKGLLDLYINPVKGATAIPPEAWQKLIDYLEENGFRYGIELTDGPVDPLMGYIVPPKLADVRENSTFAANYTGASQVVYAITDMSGNLIDSGSEGLTDGMFMKRIPPDGRQIAVVVNEPFAVGAKTGLQNYWDGFGDYRDRVLALFSRIRLGKGFRFFVDPYINEMGMRGNSNQMIPDSAAFRMELQVALEKRYKEDIAALNEKWILHYNGPKDFEVASRLIPLQQGAGYAFDPETGTFYPCTAQVWTDIAGFRNSSVARYMNMAADLLKSKVANVPVIFKWLQSSSIFTNTDAKGGFDGLGMEIYTRGKSIGEKGIQAFSQVEDAARTQWLVVTETQSTADPAKSDMGYPSEAQMHEDLDWLRRAGAKGFYIFGFQLLPQPTWNNFELLRAPEQLDWLVRYRAELDAIPTLSDDAPRALLFPSNLYPGWVRLLNNDIWMTPTRRTGNTLGLPEGFEGFYFVDHPLTSVIWSTSGDQQVSLIVNKGRIVEFRSPDGKLLKIKPDKRNRCRFTLTSEPIIIKGLEPVEIFPPEMVRAAILEFEKLVATAELRKLPSAAGYKQLLSNAKIIFTEAMSRPAYDTIRAPMLRLKKELSAPPPSGKNDEPGSFPSENRNAPPLDSNPPPS